MTHEIGDSVILQYKKPYYYIVKNIDENDEDTYSGIITCKHTNPKSISKLDEFYKMIEGKDHGKIKESIIYSIDMINKYEKLWNKLYDVKTVYCVHLNDLEEFGSDIVDSTPSCCKIHSENICDIHGGKFKDTGYLLSYSCYIAAIGDI